MEQQREENVRKFKTGVKVTIDDATYWMPFYFVTAGLRGNLYCLYCYWIGAVEIAPGSL